MADLLSDGQRDALLLLRRGDCPDCALGQQEDVDGVLYTCRTCAGSGYKPFRVLVCGSRDWPSGDAIRARLNQFPFPVTVVHGAARGADRHAHHMALALGHQVEPHPANWDKHGKAAGFIRNVEMLDSGVDMVLAFHLNGSRGTQHTINEARKRGLPVEVVNG